MYYTPLVLPVDSSVALVLPVAASATLNLPIEPTVDLALKFGLVTSGVVKHLWTPADMPTNLKLWLAADKIFGLSDGAPVASWVDSSGAGSTATASTSDKQPLYKTNILNGKPVVRWNGTTNRMQLAGFGATMSALDTYHVMFVANPTTTGNYPILLTWPDNAPWQWLMEYDSSGGFYWGQLNGSYRLYANNFNISAWAWMNLDKTGATAGKFYKNATEAATFSNSGVGLSAAPTMSGDMVLGAYYNGVDADSFGGDLAEVIVYTTSLGDATRQKLEGYVAWKYGLQASLPAGHPYLAAAPLA